MRVLLNKATAFILSVSVAFSALFTCICAFAASDAVSVLTYPASDGILTPGNSDNYTVVYSDSAEYNGAVASAAEFTLTEAGNSAITHWDRMNYLSAVFSLFNEQ